MRLWQAALLAIVVAMFVITVVGVAFNLDVPERVVVGLMASVPAIVVGAGLWRLVCRSSARSRIHVESAILAGIASAAIYSALVLRVTESPSDSDGAAIATAIWLMWTAPVALVIGAAFGAGWGQWKD